MGEGSRDFHLSPEGTKDHNIVPAFYEIPFPKDIPKIQSGREFLTELSFVLTPMLLSGRYTPSDKDCLG